MTLWKDWGSSQQASSVQTQVGLLLNFAEAPAGETNSHVSEEHPSTVTPSCMHWKHAKAAACTLAYLLDAKTHHEEKTSVLDQHVVMSAALGKMPRNSFHQHHQTKGWVEDPSAPSNLALVLPSMNGGGMKSSWDAKKIPGLSLSLAARSSLLFKLKQKINC